MKLVIFDCDGTLVDSQNIIFEAMRRAFIGAGIAPLPREQVLSIVGLSLPHAIEALLPASSPATIAAVTDGYRGAFGELRRDPAHQEPLFDGILDLIEGLSARDDVLLGVATGKSVRGVAALFERMALTHHFVTIQTADTHPSKPHPSMIETAMRETGADPDQTVMIGDTSFDMAMARSARVGAIGVGWGYHPVEELVSAGAHEIVEASNQLDQAIFRVLAREVKDDR